MSTFTNGSTLQSIRSLYVQGRYVYAGLLSANNKLVVIDVSNPASPTSMNGSGTATSTDPTSIYVQDRYAYVAAENGNVLQVFDVSNPSSPLDVSSGGISTGASSQPRMVFVSGRYAYVVLEGTSKLDVFDLGGAYIQQLEAGGAELGTLEVDSNSMFAGDVNIQGGTTIGQSLNVNGNVAIGGTTQTSGDVNVGTRYGNRLFSDNFESGGLSLWNGATAGSVIPTVSTTQAHGGKYAARINTTTSNGYVSTPIANSTTVYLRFSVNVTSQSTAGGTLFLLRDSAGGSWEIYRANGDSSLSLFNSHTGTTDFSGGAGAGLFTLNAWHQVEVEINTGGSALTAAWFDGTQIWNANKNNGSGVTINRIDLGIDPADSETESAYIDDVSVDNVSNGTASSLNVDDSFHVGGTSSFGSSVVFQNASSNNVLEIDTSTATITTGRGNLNVYQGVTSPTATLATAAGGTLAANTYSYRVAAVTEGGVATAVDSSPLSISAALNNKNTLTWTAATGATGYKIWRATGVLPQCNWASTTISGGALTTFVDTGSITFTGSACKASAGTGATIGNVNLNDGSAINLDTSGNAYLYKNNVTNQVQLANWNNGGSISLQAESLNFQDTDNGYTELQLTSGNNPQISMFGDANIGTRYGNRLFSDNFESGNFNLWNSGTSGSVTADTTTVHNGKYAAKINEAANFSAAYNNLPGTSSTIYMRMWVYATTRSASVNNYFADVDGVTSGVKLYYDTTQHLCAWNITTGASAGCSATTVATGGWHLVELRTTSGNPTGTIQVTLDGAQVVNVTSINNGTGNFLSADIGDIDGTSTYNISIDDVSVDTVSNGVPSSLSIDDTLHVGGSTSFGGDIEVQNAAGTEIFGVDRTNGRVTISNTVAGSGQTLLTVQNSNNISIFNVQDLNSTFGGAATTGAFISNMSYLGEEFNADPQNTAITANAVVGDENRFNWRTTSATATYSTPRTVNGAARLIYGTTSGVGSMLSYGTLTVNGNAIDSILKTSNLPVMQTKFIPVQSGGALTATTDYFIGMADTTTPPTANDTLPANGVLLWTNNSVPATGGTLTLQGIVRATSATVGTPVSCSGAYTFGNSIVARISVLSTTTVNFQVDFNAGDGINFTNCGTVTGTFPTAQLSPEFYAVHNEATTRQFDIDYMRIWQDDNSSADSGDTSSSSDQPTDGMTEPPITEDGASSVADQVGIIDFTTATSEDTVINGNLFVHGTIYADKIKANEIEGLSIFTDQLASLQQKLAQTTSTTTNPNGTTDSTTIIQTATTTLNLSDGLTVGGDASFHGNVFFYKLVTFTEKTLFNNDVTFAAHVTTDGTTPTYKLEAGAGDSAASASIDGNDTSGSVNITAGNNTTAGKVISVTFAKPFAKAPRVILSATNDQAANVKYYVQSTANGFTINVIDQLSGGANLQFNYFVIQ